MMMANKKNMGIGAVIALLIATYLGIDYQQNNLESIQNLPQQQNQSIPQHHSVKDDLDKIQQAFQYQKSNIQVQSSGKVIALLRDDNEGSRHQKFLLELANGQTVLVAHNIDLAPRIEALQKGDQVDFYGEYEHSDKGGVIHWTHLDPAQKHAHGWLKHQGKTYQ